MPATATRDYPSVPNSSFLRGCHGDFMRDKLGFLERAAREHGDIVWLRFGPIGIWLLSDPALIGEVFGTRGASFRKDPGLRRMSSLLGEGLLTSEGEEHDRRSRIAQPAFTKKAVDGYAAHMVELTQQAIDGWRDGQEVHISTELSKIALGIVGKALFGADLVRDAPHLADAITESLHLVDERINELVPVPLVIPTSDNRRFLRARGILDEAVLRMIRERRAEGATRPDLLSHLLRSAAEGHGGLTDEQLRDEVMTLFLAGHETTANGLSFTFWLLAKHPEVLAKVREEVDRVVGPRAATAADAHHLTYTAQVFTESIRLFPPAWAMGREAVEDVELGGKLRVRRGELIFMVPFIVQRDARWFPDPLAFKPERFAPDAPRPVPYAYFPFGGGKRACIGRSFAVLEGTLITATIARAVDFEMDTSREPKLAPLITLRPEDGIPAVVRKRKLAFT